MNSESYISISTNILVQGSFKGKYETSTYEVGENHRLSNFEFLSAEVHNAKLSEGIIPSFTTNLFIERKELEVEIILGDASVPEEFRFVEDLKNIRIYDVELFNQVSDGDKIFGEITGKIVGILDLNDKNLGYSGLIAPKYEEEIIEEKKFKRRDILEIDDAPWSFDWLWYILVLLVFFGLLYLISQIDLPKTTYSRPDYSSFTQTSRSSDYIILKPINGQKYVSVRIDGQWYDFLLDTGASMSTTSKDIVSELIRAGFINQKEHFKGYQMFSIADGSRVRGEIWNIPQIELGSVVLKNVDFVALEGSDTNLLGMSTLDRLGDYVIEPSKNRIIIK